MWNPRFYALVVCVGLLARASYRGGLRELNGELGDWLALITFCIPLVGVLWIIASLVAPVVRRWIRERS
jgi:hypothetical protein